MSKPWEREPSPDGYPTVTSQTQDKLVQIAGATINTKGSAA